MKKIEKYILTLILCTAALLGVGCQKDVSFQTNIVLKAWGQQSSGGELHKLHDVLLYGCVADTTQYTVATYEDALAGRLTHKRDGSVLEAQFAGMECNLDDFGRTMIMPAPEAPSLLILVVDRENRLYGYTQQQMVENLPYMYISTKFQIWKESAAYKDGVWWFFNPFYTPNIHCTILPKYQEVKEGEVNFMKSSRLFAYRLDNPEDWAPTDWTNAEVGRLTNRTTGAIADPDYSFGAETQGSLSAKFPPADYLLMVVNAANKCYALRPFTEQEIREKAESESEEKGFELIFPFWNLELPYVSDNGWSCHYTPEISTTITTQLSTPEGESAPIEGSVLHAWALNREEQKSWRPTSLKDALEGRLTNTESGEVLEAEESFEFDGQEMLTISLPLNEYLLLVGNEQCSSYALHTFDKDQSGKEMELTFSTQIASSPEFLASGWELYYLPNLSGRIITTLEAIESGDATEGSTTPIMGSKLFAFEAPEDPALWMPRNLADANEGRLQNSLTGEIVTAAHEVTLSNDGSLPKTIPHGDYLLMVSNFNSGCYALKSHAATIDPIEEEICFPIWRNDFPIEESSGWLLCYTPNVRATIDVTVQFTEEKEPQPLDRTLLFVYRTESPTDWAPSDYAAATEGELTNRLTGETLLPENSYEAERGESKLQVNLLRDNYLLMVVGHYQCYALRTLSAEETGIEAPLCFELWRTDSPHTNEAGWAVYNDYKSPITE